MGFQKGNIPPQEWQFFLDLGNETGRSPRFYCGFPSIREENGHIVHLGLSGNALRRLPESLGNLEKLRILDVTKNPRIKIPSSITELINLEVCYFDAEGGVELPTTIYKLKMKKQYGECQMRFIFTYKSYDHNTLKDEELNDVFCYAKYIDTNNSNHKKLETTPERYNWKDYINFYKP